jgi:hypothetical protein
MASDGDHVWRRPKSYHAAGSLGFVASPRTLYRMKTDTVRLKDRADAALLRERFGIEDE